MGHHTAPGRDFIQYRGPHGRVLLPQPETHHPIDGQWGKLSEGDHQHKPMAAQF
eukprot:CAMPEP_0174254764 /NCGR_PEP_ID=MMETSP0439-20130205/4103_1 /TAXON_ID=0 /ORGANISM="Stereomyxa ramosa, Strain Chinc5" /LENGTH=53 /DNA_ID=CAMNT_0015336565 /DNA_START=53 /DNA_END=211 /DNA_ORIENTATION=+